MVPLQLPALTYSTRLYFENAFLLIYVCVYLCKNNKFNSIQFAPPLQIFCAPQFKNPGIDDSSTFIVVIVAE